MGGYGGIWHRGPNVFFFRRWLLDFLQFGASNGATLSLENFGGEDTDSPGRHRPQTVLFESSALPGQVGPLAHNLILSLATRSDHQSLVPENGTVTGGLIDMRQSGRPPAYFTPFSIA